MTRPWKGASSAFTLIELLVVIAIIAILIGLLLPAVQKVRDSAARIKCGNNLRQIGLGMIHFHDNYGELPSSGTGDSGNPATNRKDWGWTYEILPYIEQQPLYDIPGDSSNATSPQTNGPNDTKVRKTPVHTYVCGSRRPPGLYRGNWAKSDYAGNGGSRPECDAEFNNGVILKVRGSKNKGAGVRLNGITDGASNTMLVGEKLVNLNPGSNDYVDNESWAGPGIDGDIMRGCIKTEDNSWTVPLMDADFGKTLPGVDGAKPVPNVSKPPLGIDTALNFRFGSAHRNGCQAVFGDGSVKTIRYQVSPELFRRICERSDGEATNLNDL